MDNYSNISQEKPERIKNPPISENRKILPAGTLLNQKYIIKELIKSGTMCTIYLAEDSNSGKAYAIKEYSPFETLLEQEKEYTITKVLNEFNLLYEFNSSQIPGAEEYFTVNEYYYLVKDYIEGKDLESILKERGKPGLPLKDVINWGVQICEVLEYIHNYTPPIVYRDLKPSNIMVKDSDNTIALIDFSLASFFYESLSNVPRTKIGTAGFMPPEQFLGKISPASDIFALGATIYYLLVGELQVLYGYKPMHSINEEIPEELDIIVQRSLQARAEDRFLTITGMKMALESFYRNELFVTRKISEEDLWIGELYSVDDTKAKLEAINTLEKFISSPKITQPLVDILTTEKDISCREGAARVLGIQKSNKALPPLIEKTRDKNINIRIACIKSLGNYKNPRAIKSLIKCLKDKNGSVRKAATRALETSNDKSALQALKEARGKENFFSIAVKKAMDKAINVLEEKEKLNKLTETEAEVLNIPLSIDLVTGEESEEFEYKEKDKIYLKLIFELLAMGSELSIALILHNKEKLDERFFELLDYEYRAILNRDSNKLEELKYLIQVMENLRVPEKIAPTYKPKQEELEELKNITFEEIRKIKRGKSILSEDKVIRKKEETVIEVIREKEETIVEERPHIPDKNTLPGAALEASDEVKKLLWKKAEKDFPDNRMMQEYYYFNLIQEYLSQEKSGQKNN